MNEKPENSAPVGSDELLAVGDEVTWCHSSSNGKSISFSTRNGKIIDITGSTAMAKMRNGRTQRLPVHRFRKKGQQTELTEAFMAASKEANKTAHQPPKAD